MTADRCVLAIDIGTSSSRAALVDFSGNILASAAQACDLESPAPGWAQQDARLWWRVSVENIRSVFEKKRDFARRRDRGGCWRPDARYHSHRFFRAGTHAGSSAVVR
jgi:sugar (pentulose or hexulose) kinase